MKEWTAIRVLRDTRHRMRIIASLNGLNLHEMLKKLISQEEEKLGIKNAN